MAKVTILNPFDQIAKPLEGARTQIAIEVFHMVFGAIYQDHIFKFKNSYYSLHPNSGITPNFENFTLSL